jgi:uncharacterized cupredoxin-like copper-binding protein
MSVGAALAMTAASPLAMAKDPRGAVIHVTLDDVTSDPALSGEKNMAMTLDATSVKAGPVTLEVHNASKTTMHEMVLVLLRTPNEAMPMDARADRVIEDKVKHLGEVADLEPGSSGTLRRKLAPGNYALICNQPGHYHAGMWTTLTVTK